MGVYEVEQKISVTKETIKTKVDNLVSDGIKLISALPDSHISFCAERQLKNSLASLKTSFNYAYESTSGSDIYFNLKVVREEIEESSFWFQFLLDGKLADDEHVKALLCQASDIDSLAIASLKTHGKLIK